MIYKSISKYDFVNAFEQSESYNNKFSRLGLFALYEYLYELSESIGDIELDIVAIACDYSEFDNLDDFRTQYNDDKHVSVESINEHTEVITGYNGDKFIIRNF